MSITKDKKNEAIQDFKRDGEDTGSPKVQIAILTNRINSLTEHMKKHHKDYANASWSAGHGEPSSSLARLLEATRSPEVSGHVGPPWYS